MNRRLHGLIHNDLDALRQTANYAFTEAHEEGRARNDHVSCKAPGLWTRDQDRKSEHPCKYSTTTYWKTSTHRPM